MLSPMCPSCASADGFTVLGLEDGRILLQCTYCMHNFKAVDGPELVPCSPFWRDCSNWVQEGVEYCSSCNEDHGKFCSYDMEEHSAAVTRRA